MRRKYLDLESHVSPPETSGGSSVRGLQRCQVMSHFAVSFVETDCHHDDSSQAELISFVRREFEIGKKHSVVWTPEFENEVVTYGRTAYCLSAKRKRKSFPEEERKTLEQKTCDWSEEEPLSLRNPSRFGVRPSETKNCQDRARDHINIKYRIKNLKTEQKRERLLIRRQFGLVMKSAKPNSLIDPCCAGKARKLIRKSLGYTIFYRWKKQRTEIVFPLQNENDRLKLPFAELENTLSLVEVNAAK